jgi:hypothetical protein
MPRRGQELGGAAAETDGQRIVQVALGIEMSFIRRKLLGGAEGLAGGQDRDLGHRICVFGTQRDQGMAGLVNGDGSLLAGK